MFPTVATSTVKTNDNNRSNNNNKNKFSSRMFFLTNLKRSFTRVTSQVGSVLDTSQRTSTTSCESTITDDDYDGSSRRGSSLLYMNKNSNNSRRSSSSSSSKQSTTNNKDTFDVQESSIVSVSPKTELVTSKLPLGMSFQPKVPYPQWDYNWDNRHGTTNTNNNNNTNINKNSINGGAVTRHIILVRHGQYEMESTDDKLRVLTPLGRQQAIVTGQRLASLTAAVSNATSSSSLLNEPNEQSIESESKIKSKNTNNMHRAAQPCKIKAMHVSSLTRAIETANIIGSILQEQQNQPINGATEISSSVSSTIVHRTKPDPLLSETLPSYIVPDRPDVTFQSPKDRDEGFQQAEDAFQKYFYRSTVTTTESLSSKADKELGQQQQQQHEFEIIVCHANIIRYFVCRALQVRYVTKQSFQKICYNRNVQLILCLLFLFCFVLFCVFKQTYKQFSLPLM
jgi:serine/threonine-protein phosphatase PGAM5